jgi:hypothetical protein
MQAVLESLRAEAAAEAETAHRTLAAKEGVLLVTRALAGEQVCVTRSCLEAA